MIIFSWQEIANYKEDDLVKKEDDLIKGEDDLVTRMETWLKRRTLG